MADHPGYPLGSAHPVPALRSRAQVSRVLYGIPGFLLDWLPMFIVLFTYDAIHNRLGALLPRAHTLAQIHVDQALFGATVPTVRMQQALYSPTHPHWWDFTALAVYTSHFVALVLIALVLWMRSRDRYLRFMVWFVGLTTLGFITYILYPAVPPWLASRHGDLAPTHRVVRELWDYLGFHTIAGFFSGTNVCVNDVAAIPSLHAAYPLMIAWFLWGRAGRLQRTVLVLYPVTMAVALVYTAEHYVLDVVLGWLYVLVTGFVMQRFWPLDSRLNPKPWTRLRGSWFGSRSANNVSAN